MLIERLQSELSRILADLGHGYPAGVTISEPPEHISGDFSTNIAMQLAREAGKNPRELAEAIKEQLGVVEGVTGVELAGPGFLNIALSDAWYLESLVAGKQQPVYPKVDSAEKIHVEYVSANPSGPLHIGNARGGPIGEAIVRVLQAVGHEVAREFYVNDVGGQANRFAASVLHYYRLHFGKPSEFPEGGYPAQYVQDLAEEIAQSEGGRVIELPEDEQREAMRKVAIARMIEKIKASTDQMNIHFDRWFWQSELHASGLVQETLRLLQERNATLDKDGALWLKSGILEDDRETVLVKSDGATTYFLDDLAYHRDKCSIRHFDRSIVLLGANHSGHTPRMNAGVKAIGFDEGTYEGVVYQYVQLREGNEIKKMGKRFGTFITSDDVLDDVPLEVFTYFMVSKANETHLDFDLQLAKDTSEKNPVYYIQYAHARICSVLERATEQGSELPEAYQYNPEERRLLRHLMAFGGVIKEVSGSFRVHLIAAYLHELATRYHHFYAHHRIITEDASATSMRLALSRLTAATLKEGLYLLNIEALQKM